MTLKRVVRKKIGELLMESEKISKDELERALKTQKDKGGFLGEILVDMGVISDEEIAACLCIQYGLPFMALQNYDFDDHILSLVPKELIENYHCIPLDQMGKVLTVAVPDPLDEETIKKIEKLTGNQVQYFICSYSALKETADKLLKQEEEEEGKVEKEKKVVKETSPAPEAKKDKEDKEEKAS